MQFKSTICILALMAFLVKCEKSMAQIRLFADLPSIYLHTGDVQNIKQNVGAGIDLAFAAGTHHLFGKTSVGTTATVSLNENDVTESLDFTPFAKLEAGAGLYRSNGNKCSLHDSNAFTAAPKVGMIYPFVKDGELSYFVGVELGYFRIKDWFRNNELVLDAGYNLDSKKIYVNFGYKMFLNLRGRQ